MACVRHYGFVFQKVYAGGLEQGLFQVVDACSRGCGDVYCDGGVVGGEWKGQAGCYVGHVFRYEEGGVMGKGSVDFVAGLE